MQPSVLAIAAHPDDIEFVMAGTLLRLLERGWQAHYFNIANGCCGSMTLSREAAAAARLSEARAAAALMPAEFYPPICDDLAIFYTPQLLAQVAAVIRQARPQIVLTHSPVDYMEDHQNAARLAVSAAFVRGMPNFQTQPPTNICTGDVAVYHAQPHGNRTPLGEIVEPNIYVDVTSVMDRKSELLAAHQSQASWLDETQHMGSYLEALRELNRETAGLGGQSEFAEGWRQHLQLGFASADFDPLTQALGGRSLEGRVYCG